jgi:phosphatidylinositol alpha-1,6-mannosyltransferase
VTVSRIIVAAPGVAGSDGASELARQWIDALDASAGPETALEVWSLTDTSAPASLPARAVFTTAAGNRWRFASMAMRAGTSGARTLLVVMHVHLLPALMPLLWRGAHAVTVMLGIEVWKPLRPLERIALRRSWRLAAVSAHTVERFRHENPALADLPVAVCHPRVPSAVPADARDQRADVAASPFPMPYALLVGRMAADERYKGHDLLIDIWPRIVRAAPNASLVVAGGGDDIERLRQKVSAAGLSDRVRFAGQVTAGQLAALYRDAAFFVMPSAGEGFGIVFLEAMRAGKPCVAGAGAAEEIITDGEDGVIVDPARPDDVVDAVVRLFLDAAYRGRLGTAARECVERRFTAAQLTARVSALLTDGC